MKKFVVFGYGAVGRDTTRLLVERGDDVLVAQRSEPKGLPAAARFQACDVTDAAAVASACDGRDVAMCAAGFPYDAKVWEASWPAAMRALLDGCRRSGARFVFADNLYMYGPQTEPLVETMPLTSYGRKPRVRAQITAMWQDAASAGEVKAVAVRASDFYGPDVATSVLSAYGVANLVARKAAVVPYSPDYPHDFTYVPDFARALVALADAPDDAYGQAYHVSNAPTKTLRELLALAAQIANVPCRLQILPAWVRPVLAIFQPVIGELAEMRFQTDRPYHVDATKFQARFGGATSFEDGLAETIRFYRP